MTTNPNNPFVLPGLGQSGDMASNPLFASLEMMRQTFDTLAGAGGLGKSLSMQPTLDPAELEKKINELKSVENWLKLNLSMLTSTIQGMEVQLATINTLQQFMSAQASASTPPNATSPSASTPSATPPGASSASKEPKGAQPSTEAAQAWWNMLTQQFGQIAAATTASMGNMNDAQTGASARAPQNEEPVKKTPARQRATTSSTRSSRSK